MPVLVMDSQFSISDIIRQLPVQCGQWEAITMGSLRGLVVLAWAMECPGEEQEGTHLRQGRIMGASFRVELWTGGTSLIHCRRKLFVSAKLECDDSG
ncbi:uncharacterized LOC100217185 [Zea mays]|uniref:Uncharacterized protein n=1 Tax=Zea mays TaxID=4577 RepID=B4FLU5_MAIZE|nr:uncharacterized LOC100217185 [Zea mays]ACF83088.1 unknown [Zea mays]|eukprot:NP_001137017.1 uncharacterized protein LOC100217185 [Zea mays]